MTNLKVNLTKIVYYTFLPTDCPLIVELKNAKYEFRVENMEFKIPSLRYIGLFSQSTVSQSTEGL